MARGDKVRERQDLALTDERWNRIWTEMRTGSARSRSINTLQFGMRNFCCTRRVSVNNFLHVFVFSVAV